MDQCRDVWLFRDKFYNQQASLGSLYVLDENSDRIFKGVSVELGYVDNQNRISCIPVGDFDLVYEWSPAFEMMLWEIYGVPGRSECKFHTANFFWQLNGCIGPGRFEKFIDGDNILDVAYSKDTLERFHKAMEPLKKAKLHVRNLEFV